MRLTRRRFLVLGGAAGLTGGAALVSGTATPRGAERPAATAAGPYVTMPHLQPPTMSARRGGVPERGLLFLGPFRGTAHADGLIVDDTGEPVWVQQSQQTITDLRVQTFEGQPVLTYWEGERRTGGYGWGNGIILDRAYRKIAEVRAAGGEGVHVDLHEFQLTDRGTALIIAYPLVRADMRAIGGPRDGHVFDNRVQEIDIRTGRVLFDWSALEHVDIAETVTPLADNADGTDGKPFDPVHVNSVEADGDALLLSARNTSALYRIDRRTGRIRWRLGGTRGDFELGEGVEFKWQHDARRRPDGTITLFDNAITEAESGPSRGIVLKVDERAGRADLVWEYTDGATFGHYMANLQMLPGGNVLLGYGSTASVIEYTPGGDVVYELQTGQSSYRAYRHAWTGRPETPPLVASRPASGGMRLYASWNGATEVAAWRFLTGPSPSRLTPATTVRRSGFETSARVKRAASALAVALDAHGAELGRSAPLNTRDEANTAV
ncbi:arylsulfotransferase family protein [Actinomadura sp. LOL_016]|uniref:arylsulfotransferase family protein n=1 Tax=unclassified Actinomadura TaxID=2626254 RepID=UPI003A80F6F7